MKNVILLFLMLICPPLIAQEKQNHEISSEVKELFEFHDVIYQIWHTGWPGKNIVFLKSLLPEVQTGYEKIKKAELSGILRDKKPKWQEGLIELEKSVNEYKTATEQNDSTALLNAAEKLHSNFEAMVRIIRPILKEVDAFHQVLYMLYHYYMQEYDYEKIKQAAAEMKLKMEDLNKANLTKRVETRKDQFEKAKQELNNSVDELNKVVSTGGKEQINSSVNIVHTKYQELEKVFD